MPASNGGYSSPLNMAMYPRYNVSSTLFFIFDTTNFNDPNDASVYDYKVEDVIAGRTPTLSRIIISYRDLGVASLFVNISGTNDEGKVVNASTTVPIGNASPTNVIMTTVVGLTLTAQNLQLSLVRLANAGPVSITKVRLEGRVERTPYA
jgi:hypothetical protein